MLDDTSLERILERLPTLTMGVVGDLFLDRYLDIDGTLTERSLETGLDAYQVVRVRPSPGAAGTVINNLVALGVKQVRVVSLTGDDGEGYELRRELKKLRVDTQWIQLSDDRRTPTYTKPMLCAPDQAPRELNRLDIKNRTPLPRSIENSLVRSLAEVWPQVDALLVLDQVSDSDCGVISRRVRDYLAYLGESEPAKFVLADSRENIGLFRSMSLKPNELECLRTTGNNSSDAETIERAVAQLAQHAGRPVFCTCGERGMVLSDPHSDSGQLQWVPSYPVNGPIDIVGAGDSTSAAIACAVAAGAELPVAAAFGCLVASITIQQIGTTGTATPEQVRQRWHEIGEAR
jgi:rfaE bifunctional protein kinase chain/domain